MSEWERKPGEKTLWYNRFWRYCQMGTGRSILAVYNEERQERDKEKAKAVPRNWGDMAKRWRWKARAEAYDEYLIEKQKQEYEERIRSHTQELWELRDAAMQKARTMLKWPLQRQQTEGENGETIVIEPANWSFRDALAYASAVDELAQRSLGAEQLTTKQNGKQGQNGESYDTPDEKMDWLKEVGRSEEADL